MTASLEASLERGTVADVPCPPWCDGRHDHLYADGTRDHFCEVGRLDDGETQLIVGVAMSIDPHGEELSPSVELLHLDNTGAPVEEMASGEIFLRPAEALALGPLLVRAAQLLAGTAE